MEGTTVEQTAITLEIKRLEKAAVLARVDMLRLMGRICAGYQQQMAIDFGRIQAYITENLAEANQVQQEVNTSRENHGKAVVFTEREHESDSDADYWDTTAEASSSLDDSSSVAGEPSSSVAGDVSMTSSV